MSQNKPRLTLQFTLRDNHGFEQLLGIAIDCDKALLKIGRPGLEVSTISFQEYMTMLRTKEMRRLLFKELALQLVELADDDKADEATHQATPT